MQTDTYNSRHLIVSPQKKPSAGTLLKNYSHRPNSAMKLKYEPESSNHSPLRNESQTSKKHSVSRYPSTTTSSTNSGSRAYESRLYGYRKKNEEDTSPAPLSKSTSKWDRHLSIETNENVGNHSVLGLKGYSVSHTSTNALSKTSSQTNPFNSSLNSKYMLYSNTSPSSAGSYAVPSRGGMTNGSANAKKYSSSSSKGHSLNSSTSSLGSGDRFFLNDSYMKEERNNSYSLHNSPSKGYHFEEEAAHLPPFEPTKCSIKQNGAIKAYAVNTHQGIVRNYNEDRVAIILNIMKPPHVTSTEEWPLCSFFGVYDGHGGTACPDFLRDNLHQYVIQDKNFPKNPVEALRRGFEEAEKAFQEIAQRNGHEVDRSGSCAIVALIVEDMCYIANVGDSRVAASFENGKKVFPLSRDHKPNDKDEQKRILSFGGKIYQSQINQPPGYPGPKVILGPHRVFPGRLSVSRTFGDIEAKIPRLGGNPYVVIAEPEIKAYKITKDWDFIILASDGIYDKMENHDVVKSIWDSTAVKETDVHKQSAVAVERLMKESLIQKTMDNITVVMVAFEGFERKNFPATAEEATKPEIEKYYQPLQRSLLSNSGSTQERLLSKHYSPPAPKSFLNTSNERQTFSAAVGRRFGDSSNSSFDYTVSSHLEKQWRGY